MTMEGYVWDDAKDAANLAKHHLSFYQAAEVFEDPLRYEFADDLHSEEEIRRRVLGKLHDGRLVVVVFTLTSEGQIRLITARRARRSEIRRYMNNPDELRDEGPEEPLDDDDVDLSTLDWKKAVRGGTVAIRIGPESIRLRHHVRVIFQGDDEVNDALEWLLNDGRWKIDFERRFARYRAEDEAAAAAAKGASKQSTSSSARPRARRSSRSKRGS